MLYVFDGVWPVQVGPLLHISALLNPAHKKNEICKLVLSSADLSSAQACSRAENKPKKRAQVLELYHMDRLHYRVVSQVGKYKYL